MLLKLGEQIRVHLERGIFLSCTMVVCKLLLRRGRNLIMRREFSALAAKTGRADKGPFGGGIFLSCTMVVCKLLLRRGRNLIMRREFSAPTTPQDAAHAQKRGVYESSRGSSLMAEKPLIG